VYGLRVPPCGVVGHPAEALLSAILVIAYNFPKVYPGLAPSAVHAIFDGTTNRGREFLAQGLEAPGASAVVCPVADLCPAADTDTVGDDRRKKSGAHRYRQLVALRTEVAAWTALEGAIREPLSIYAPPASGGMFNVRFSLRPRYRGEARNALAAVLACPADIKQAFAVDDDIDVFSNEQTEWALATHFQAERDLLLMTGMRAFPLDPSLDGTQLGSKVGFDLTMPFGAKGSPEFSVPSVPHMGATPGHGTVEAALASGSKTFFEIMKAIGSRDGREILGSFDDLR